MKKEKKEEESGSGNLYMNLDKTAVLQEARAFNETPINARRCTVILSKLLYLRQQGESIGRVEATEAFFAVTKLWQSKDASLRRLVYLAVKELCDIANDVIIVTSSLTKDMTGREDVYRAPAIRALCCIIDGSMLQGIERYMKQAIVDKNPAVASAAIVSSLHLLKKNPEIVRRWANEVQEAVSSDSNMVQLHALGLLYHIRSNDHLAVNKLVQKWSKSSLRSPFATCYLLKLASKIIEEDDAGSDSPLFHFIESCLRHKCEMVIYEAASAIVRLPRTSSSELSSAVSVLQLFCSSPKPALRFAAVRTLNKVSIKHPQAVISCNVDLEQLITDQNRSIATLAITTLLKTGAESSVERLMKQISTFVSEISDEFKIVVIEAIRLLCERYPRKHTIMMTFLATMLRDDGGFDYKKSIVETVIAIIEGNPDAKEAGLSHLCEFIEDCEHAALATRVLHLLGREAPNTPNPSRYIRFIYNRVILESNQVRAAAVTALAMFGAHCPDLRGSIQVLLQRCLLDTDDEVRDRATYYLTILQTENPQIITDFILCDLQVSVVGLERALEAYLNSGQFDVPFDLESVPMSTELLAPSDAFKALSGDHAPSKKEEKKLSRYDAYAEQLRNIEEFSSLGPLIRSSQIIALTDDVTEYIVTCIKHTFKNHIILQFDCKNTLNDQLLEDVRIELEADNIGDWSILHVIPIAELPFSVHATSYILLEIPTEATSTVFEATLKFRVKDVDPVSGEQESDDFYDDSFVLEELEISVADFMQALPCASFATAWQGIGDDNELEETFVLSALHSLQDAMREVMKCIGLCACERSDRVQEGKNSHTLLLAGLYRGLYEVLVKARLALNPANQTVTMNLLIRSQNPIVRDLIASAIA